jgi:uracil-DNA glycosylase family 4
LGQTGPGLRRSRGAVARRRARASGARREPHRPHVHGRLERHLAVQALYRYGFASQPQSLSRDDGLALNDCYIAAAARCAPPGNKPSRVELERCRPYLAAEVRLLPRMRVVVTLGRIAHESWLKAAGWWQRLAPRERPPFRHGVASNLPDGTVVIASYHPSRQNTNTGKLTRAMWYAVFRRARAALEHRG